MATSSKYLNAIRKKKAIRNKFLQQRQYLIQTANNLVAWKNDFICSIDEIMNSGGISPGRTIRHSISHDVYRNCSVLRLY